MEKLNKSEVLQKARETYGTKAQILVCIEELNELACVLAKYPRYDDEEWAKINLHSKILDEYVDVTIILDHVKNIAGLSDSEIAVRQDAKIDRLSRWLNESNSQQQTFKDREVIEHDLCKECVNPNKSPDFCGSCFKNNSMEGTLPYFVKG